MGDIVGGFLKTFEEYPPAQKPGSFTISDAFHSLKAMPQQ
jgi:hypothetical protein